MTIMESPTKANFPVSKHAFYTSILESIIQYIQQFSFHFPCFLSFFFLLGRTSENRWIKF